MDDVSVSMKMICLNASIKKKLLCSWSAAGRGRRFWAEGQHGHGRGHGRGRW